MRKAILVAIVAVAALAWTSRGQAVYAATMSCQGHDLVVESLCNYSSSNTSSDVCDASWGLFNISDVAIWSVTTLNNKFTGGTLIATYQEYECTFTCTYSLDARNSGFLTTSGILVQDLHWVGVDCMSEFWDTVFTVSSGIDGVMNDTSLAGDDAAGSGTCVNR